MKMPSTSTSSSKRGAEAVFENDILPARTWASISRTVVLQMLTLLLFNLARSLFLLEPFLENGSGFPIGWIKSGLNSLIHPSSWFYDSLIIGCVWLIGMLYLQKFQMSPKIPQGPGGGGLKSILATTIIAVTSNGIINATTSLSAHMVLSAILLKCYIGIIGPASLSSLTILCNHASKDVCINEQHIFLIVSGIFTGIRIWWKLQGPSNGQVLRFPLIQLSGNTLLRQRIGSELVKDMFDVALSLRLYCFLYYMLGMKVEIFLADVLRIDHRSYHEDESNVFAETYHEMIWSYATLVLHTWVINALLVLNFGLLHAIFNINMTKRTKFPILHLEKPPTAYINLMDAMRNDGTKSNVKESGLLLKHLAFQDFAEIAASESKVRRSEFFTLSQPGGHPHHWNEVRSICLNTISEFSGDLEKASKPANIVTATPLTPLPAGPNSNFNLATQTPTMPRLRRLGGPQNQITDTIEKLGHSSGIQEVLPSKLSVLQGSTNSNLVTEKEKYGLRTLERYLFSPEKIGTAVTNAASVFTIPGPSGDTAIRSVYAKSQVVIWSVEGLAHLIAASIDEDRFGVVQKDLPEVLEAFLLLQKTVEKHRKGATATARKNRFETRDLQLKQELRVALKSSLFRICVAFGEHLLALPISLELRKKLSNYQSFAEA